MKVVWHKPHSPNRTAFIAPTQSTAIPFGNEGTVEVITLKNGLRLVLQNIPYAESCIINVLAGAGSITETKDLQGISHFLEHMLFRGTTNRKEEEIYRIVELGVDFNASTTEEHTSYYVVGPGDFAGDFADLLLDMCLNPKFQDKKIQREKPIVCLELEGRRDLPDEHIFDLVTGQMYGSHPYGRNVIGTKRSVKSFTRDDLRHYHKFAYNPQNVILVARGKFERDRVIEVAESFNQIPDTDFVLQNVPVKRNYPGIVVDKRDTDVAFMAVLTTGCSLYDRDSSVIDVINMALNSPVNSRIYKKVVRDGQMAYSANAALDSSRYAGYIGVVVKSVDPSSVDRVADITIAEFEKLRERGLTPEQLVTLQRQCRAVKQLSGTTYDEAAQSLAKSVLYHGVPHTLDDYNRGIDAVTLDDVSRVSRRIFRPENYAVAVIGPKKMPKVRI